MTSDRSSSSSQRANYKVDALIVHNPSITSSESEPSAAYTRVNATAIACPKTGIIEAASLVFKQTVSGYEIIDFGTRQEIDAKVESAQLPARMIELTLHDRLLMPGLVNAHTHLDLTHIGPVAHDPAEGFVKWVDIIRKERRMEDAGIRDAVAAGIRASLAGGSVAVGDIAGAPMGRITDAPALELASSPIVGVSYLEFLLLSQSIRCA